MRVASAGAAAILRRSGLQQPLESVAFTGAYCNAQLFRRYRQPSGVTNPTRRQFWIALLWLGLIQAVDWSLAILQIGVWPGNAAALATVVLLL
jgi:hypothetical protein